MAWKCCQACSASCSVRSSTNHDPPAGSSTRPTCDSSNSSSWVLRAIRRAKLAAPRRESRPGSPRRTGTPARCRRRRRPRRKRPACVRSMFTHGSRWVIIGSDVSACTMAAPPSGSPTTSATRAHSWRAAPHFGDRHELVVVGGQPEADLPQRVADRDPGFGEHPQVGHRGRDAAGELPRRVGAQIVEGGTVDGDRPHARRFPATRRCDGDHVAPSTGPPGRSAARSAGRRPGRSTAVLRWSSPAGPPAPAAHRRPRT